MLARSVAWWPSEEVETPAISVRRRRPVPPRARAASEPGTRVAEPLKLERGGELSDWFFGERRSGERKL